MRYSLDVLRISQSRNSFSDVLVSIFDNFQNGKFRKFQKI